MDEFKIESMWRDGGARKRIIRRPASNPNTPDSLANAGKGGMLITAANYHNDLERQHYGVSSCLVDPSLSTESTNSITDTDLEALQDSKEMEDEEDDWFFGDRTEDLRSRNDGRRSVYGQSCDLVGVLEKVSINKCLQLTECSLRYNLLSESQIKCLSVSLMHNDTVQTLDLRSCGVNTQSCQYICEMLEYNHCISCLDLSENSLRTAGLILIKDCLPMNLKLLKLSLDYDELRDADSIHIREILQENTILTHLSLRGNSFSITAGAHLKAALLDNDTLCSLDLSWNKLRLEGAMVFCQGVQDNMKLTDLNLSWNGLGLQGCAAMSKCLKSNTTLQNLDMSANRITREAFKCLLVGLFENKTLVKLKVGDNPITTEGVMDFMDRLMKSTPTDTLTKLEEIDFADICVGSDFGKLYNELRMKRPMVIKHGAALRQDDLIQIDLVTVVHSEQPVFILFDCMKRSNLRIVDLFHAFDKDKSNTLTRQELREGLQTMNIPLSSRALDLLIKHTDTDNDGEISLTDLMACQKDYQKFLAKKRSQKERKTKSALNRMKTLSNIAT